MVAQTHLLATIEWEQIYNYMFNATNLYRSMLGLPTLFLNPNLESASTEISKYYVSKALERREYNDDMITIFEEKLRQDFPNDEHYGMGRNVYCSRTVNENCGIEAFNTWQLSEDGNQILKYKDFDYMGIGYEDDTQDGKMGIIYVTQQFVRTSCNKETKQTIDFTSEMCDHLNNYSNLVLYNLNKLLDENIEYVNDWSAYPIQMNPLLNNIATYQLFLTIDDRLNEENIDRCVENLLCSYRFDKTRIFKRTYISPTYISPARLVNSEEGLSKDFIERIKNGDFNRFGINVALFDNKTFLLSIIFAKSN